MNKYRFEVCATSIEDVRAAIEGGADRVELCQNLEADGLTPDYNMIKKSVELAREAGRPFEVMVLVRSRQGDFVYSEEEKELMKQNVSDICGLGVDGVVVGALNPDLTVDTKWIGQIVELVHRKQLSVTFHRAFDSVRDFSSALESLAHLGVDRILTAGCRGGAEKGMNTLAMLWRQAEGRIIIMPGGGVRSSNISRLHGTTGTREYHSSCRCSSENDRKSASLTEIRKIAEYLNAQS